LATPALLAHILVSKYCDHLPLYRQSQIFARQGVEIDRSTLANWVGGACWWLEPLQKRLAEHVFASQKLFADDTAIPVLDPGRYEGADGRPAVGAAVRSGTAKLKNVEPFAYFQNVLARMSSGHPMSRLDDLLPWNWRPTTALN
jgi:hypothetical protein